MADAYKKFDNSDTYPTIPEIKISSFSFRVREIVLAAVSAVALIACFVLIALVAIKNKTVDTNMSAIASAQAAINSLCIDPPCLKAASYGVSNMNISVNPCDNFYQYACGNYQVINPLNADINQRTVFWNLYYENEDKLRTLLESAPVGNAAWSSEKKLKDFFKSCIDDYGKMNAAGKTFIDKIIKPLGGWDVLNTFNSTTFDLQINLQKTSIDFWTRALFTFRVATDRLDTKKKVIEIDYGGMGMSWSYYVKSETAKVRENYKKFIRSVAVLLVRDSGLNIDPIIAANKTDRFVEDVYYIEFQLANITANTIPIQDPHNHEKRITLRNLTSETGNVINFVAFFQNMFGRENVNENTKVILMKDDWLRRMVYMISSLPESDKARKLSNYFIWRLARTYAQELSWEYIHLNRVFYKDITGSEKFWGTWYYCFWHVDQSMPEALGAMFAKQHFNDKNKQKAEEIVGYVKQALLESIDGYTFMDEETKRIAKTKVQESTHKMGYPDHYLDEDAINNLYQSLAINSTDYFQNLLNLNAFDKEDWTRLFVNEEDKSQWLYNSYDTSMAFYNSWNQLLVPAGMLQFPVYEWTLPHYFNFGSMGSLVGHYMVHAIDNWGGYYNPNGKKGHWYSNFTAKSYKNVEQCFADAIQNKSMGPYKVVGKKEPQIILVNGKTFAWDALAETSGVRLAYKAYKKWLEKEGDEQMTPTPHYTNDQRFFLSFTQTFCYTRSDTLSYYYATVQMVTEDIRTNTALSLLDEFVDAFNCPKNSPMNAKTRCNTF